MTGFFLGKGIHIGVKFQPQEVTKLHFTFAILQDSCITSAPS